MPRILFLSEACLLDRGSGAAHSARAMLHALAAAGWQVRAATLNLCDGDAEAALQRRYPQLDPEAHEGERVTVADGALTHEVLLAGSTRHAALRPWALRAFHAMAQERLAQWRPDLVLSYCSERSWPLLARARRQGARTLFYLANAGHALGRGGRLPEVDEWLVPSRAMAELYRDRHGVAPRVVGNLVTPPFDGRRNLAPARLAARRERYVTMINPQPAKGGLFFINLAAQAAALAPGVRFRALESRWGRAEWAARGVADADLDRIDWHSGTGDMARVYDEAALLLVPSLAFEASGRVIAEALLAGVPVLAMRTGGIPEQLGDGGFLFDLPEALARDPLAAPGHADLKPWGEYIRVLMGSDALYERAVRLALEAAKRHDPVRRAAQAVAVFEAVLARPALAAVADDAAAQAALARRRERMNAEREAVNARVQAGAAAAGDVPQDTPYRALLQRSLAQPAIQQALAAFNAGDWLRARGILEPYLRLLPEDIAALGLLAEVAEGQGLLAEACDALERVTMLAPGFVPGQERLIALRQRAGDVEAALMRSFERDDPARLEAYVAQVRAFYSAAFFAARAGQGHPASGPVFVLGLHDPDLALVERILTGHGAIGGARRMPRLQRIARDFVRLGPGDGPRLNTALLADLDGDEWARLGRQYLEPGDAWCDSASIFVDAMPGNWLHVGLIHLLLPNARIVDIRREQQDIARVHHAYAGLMAHFDAVLPGRVHHIRYEALAENPEAEFRRLMDYCGLPIEMNCRGCRATECGIWPPDAPTS